MASDLYRNVMVAVDNSELSDRAVELSVDLALRTGAHLTGNHVYAARLHDVRFRELEPGLPERYHGGEQLQRLRGLHDGIILRGLEIISDSYLDRFEARCRDAGVPSSRKTPEGRNYAELVRDARESRYDLVVAGAHGLGRVHRSVLGSVCERVARLVECDLLVVRDGRSPGDGHLLVAIDGSAHSFAALNRALALSRVFGSPVSAVAAYDPFFHGSAFKSIAGVLSDEASRLFRFQEQEQLHDEIIDSGLAGVYRSHLMQAREMAEQQGMPLEIQLLEGKPFDAIASHVEMLRPSLLLAGRVGIHHAEGVTLGSTTENLLRSAGCNILVVNRGVDEPATESTAGDAEDAPVAVRWTGEAEQMLHRVPPFVRRMARKRIEAFARNHGCGLVTAEVYDRARRSFGM